MGTSQIIFYNAEDADGEPGSPVECTKTLLASPFTASTIIVYFDDQKFETRLPGVAVENNSPNLKALTADLAAEKAASYTIGGVVYHEVSREKLNVEETLLNLTEVAGLAGVDVITSLVALWQGNAGNNLTQFLTDKTGRGNDLAPTNSPTVGASGLAGIPVAITFDGISQYAFKATTPDLILGATDFSLAMWVKPATDTGADRMFCSHVGIGADENDYKIGFAAIADRFVAGHFGAMVEADSFGSAVAANDAWHFIVVRSVGDVMYISVDNGPEDSAAVVTTPGGNIFYLARDSAFTEMQLAQLAIYKRALTPEEITYLFNNENGVLIVP